MLPAMKTDPATLGALAAFVLALGASSAFANGGGYVQNKGWTGDFSPRGADQVEMVSEELTIHFGPEAAEVEVVYRLKNSGRKRKVEIGFPCTTLKPDPKPGEEDYSGITPLELAGYTIAKGGEALKVRVKSEKIPAPVPGSTSGEESDALDVSGSGAWVRKWYVSDIPFDKNETAEVRVRFRQGYAEFGRYVSDDGHVSASTLSYTLSSAAIWKGPIKSGNVTLIVDSLYPDEFTIEPRDRFKREGNVYTWNFENLEPAAADDLRIQVYAPHSSYYVYSPGKLKSKGDFPSGGEYIFREDLTLFVHDRYEAKASSTLKPQGEYSYEASNLNNDDWQSAWVEGADGPGIGESVTLTMKAPLPVHHLKILPGYAASEKAWKENARVAKVEVTANAEKSWTVDLPDGGFEVLQTVPLPGYAKPVETLEVKIAGVHPGEKYEDTCITAIFVASKLDKRPEVRGAR